MFFHDSEGSTISHLSRVSSRNGRAREHFPRAIENRDDFLKDAKILKSPIGYSWLIERFHPRSLRPYHTSFVDASARRSHDEEDGRHRVEIFPRSYLRDDSPIGHLVFALKYDGLELGVLRHVLEAIPQELTRAVAEKPSSKHLRQLWFLYEWFTGHRLDLPDAPRLRSELLADPEVYFTVPGERSPRHAIVNNLLGTAAWSPSVRKTPRLLEFVGRQLDARARQIRDACDPVLLLRAVRYLYTKETKTSFAIERAEIRGRREERFVGLLQHLRDFRAFDRDMLVEVQNLIVVEKDRESEYRRGQNYIGFSLGDEERVSYIPPRPEDVPAMMDGLETMVRQLERRSTESSAFPAVIAAALVAFSFVYIHPFKDGNGRLHRFLIHYVLARLGFTPENMIFPISASILNDMASYDRVLCDVDRQVMPWITYEFADDRSILTRGNDARLYAYLDLTPHAEALYRWTERTIDVDVVKELDFLKRYDRARRLMRTVHELSDQEEDLFITFCRANDFRLLQTKRKSHFPTLTLEQIAALEAAVAAAFRPKDPEADADPDHSPT